MVKKVFGEKEFVLEQVGKEGEKKKVWLFSKLVWQLPQAAVEDWGVLELVCGQAHAGLGNIDVALVHLRNAAKGIWCFFFVWYLVCGLPSASTFFLFVFRSFLSFLSSFFS